MPTSTYTPLANVTLGSSANPVVFSSISQSYRDLVLVITGKGTSGSPAIVCSYNSDGSSIYNYVFMGGNGTNALSSSGSNINALYYALNPGNFDTTNQAQSITHIMDYSATDKHKTSLTRSDNSGAGTLAIVNRWGSTSAITSIQIYTSVGSFAAGSTFALYGIAS
jgi:hypothetical protein